MEKTGVCRFCGQEVFLTGDIPDKTQTEDELDELAALQCGCGGAVDYQREKQKEKEMEDKLEKSFRDPEEAGIFILSEEEFKPVKELSLLIIKKKLKKVTVDFDENRKASIERGKSFKITKSIKQKNVTEV